MQHRSVQWFAESLVGNKVLQADSRNTQPTKSVNNTGLYSHLIREHGQGPYAIIIAESIHVVLGSPIVSMCSVTTIE